MNRTSPPWLDRSDYPFASHVFPTPQGRMHYVDEGQGEPILFVHGNPTWSFEHRKLIAHLSKTHRCIAVDHIGFGLSDKPADAAYLPQMHADNLARFIEALDLDDITLVVHDWGGPIAMAYATTHPERFARIIAYNSWFWPVRGIKSFERFSRFMGGPFGRFLCRNFNFFPRVMMKVAVGDRRSLPPHIHRQFTSVHGKRAERKGTWVLPKAIIGESAWLDDIWSRQASIRHLPLLILWGMKDVAMDEALLDRWAGAFPHHEAHRFADVGHFAPEEIGERAFLIVDRFIEGSRP